MKTRRTGFTLVEILIVVIILGILAAIVIPQFTEASSDARESSLTSNLQTLRSQLGLFKIQHNDDYPNSTDTDTFEDRLTQKMYSMILQKQKRLNNVKTKSNVQSAFC